MRAKILSALLLAGLFSQAGLAKPEKYKIDPAHTSAVFKINHLGFAYVYGMFEEVEGNFTLDENKPANSSLSITIKTDSVETNNDKRDDHLKSPDFFNVKQFPRMTFKSSGFKKISDTKYEVTGTFELMGVKKKLTIPFERHRTGQDPWGKQRTGGSAEFTIKRSEYGMNFMQGENQLGDEVHIFFSLEGVKD